MTTPEDVAGQLDWPGEIFGHFQRANIRQIGYVPDAGHARLIEMVRTDDTIHDVVLTTEEEGVALAAGAWLGGQAAALLMQSSGVGNCINMLSLARACQFPLLMLVTMRGEWGEFNPWQVPMGSITEQALWLCQVQVFRADHSEEVSEVVGAAIDLAYNCSTPTAVLLSQRLIGAKKWLK